MPISCTRCGTPHHGNKNNSKCKCCGETIYGFERLKKVEKAIEQYLDSNSPEDIQKKFNEYVKSRKVNPS